MRFQWLITGTDRCGTDYIAQALRSVGVRCGHENVFSNTCPMGDVALMDQFDADSSWLAVPYLTLPHFSGLSVIHLVRHPKSVIDSMLRTRLWHEERKESYAWRFALPHLPEVMAWAAPECRAAHHYLKWNKMIEPYASWRHRVEDSVEILIERMGIRSQTASLFSNKTYNIRPGQDFDIGLRADLPPELYTGLMRMARRYGYHD